MPKRKKPKTVNMETPKGNVCLYCQGEKPGRQGICAKCFREFLDKTKEG